MTRIQEFKARISAYAGGELLRKSALNIRDGAGVIEGILSSGKYRRVLEIGTYRGVTAAYMASFVESVDTVDLKHGKLERGYQIFDRARLWRALGTDNVTLHLVASNEEKEALIKSLKFDFAFVDGDHSYEGVKDDFRLVSRCGAVLFHDCAPGSDVARFVGTLPIEQVTIVDLFAFWRNECRA